MPRTANRTTAERVRELFTYNPDTGVFTNRLRRSANALPGSVAGGINKAGYWTISVDNRRYLAHRLAWLYVTGNWPDKIIDHKNGDKIDNRFDNLREACHSENGCNKGPRRDNKSGIKNVMWQKHQGGWYIQLKIYGVKYFYGYFKDLELAALVAEEARDKIHGVFANHQMRGLNA